VGGAYKNDTLITCEVRDREAGVVEVSQSTIDFGDGTASGTATTTLTNIPAFLNVPGNTCRATFAITMTRTVTPD
jgi:hypothetical protein